MPVKPLTFKGDKKAKKRKHRSDDVDNPNSDRALTTTTSSETTAPSSDDSWTTPDSPSDLSGPILLVLPTHPPTCLASDAHGNVFASALENIVENYAETAEPHDVRQVWVASTVAGTGQVTLKGSHGGYLSCDAIGVLGARREARGAEEGFAVEMVGNEQESGKTRFRLRTAASKMDEGEKGHRYLSAVMDGNVSSTKKMKAGDDTDEHGAEGAKTKKISISLRGDGEVSASTFNSASTTAAESDPTLMVLKMQSRFKPRVQQNKETKAKEKVSRAELERVVGRRLEDDEVRRLKRAKKDGTYYEEILDVRVKGKHDKFAS